MNLKKIIKEEIESLRWIMDINPDDGSMFRIGDTIKVHNEGDEEAFLEWLGMFSDDYEEGHYGPNIVGKITNIYRNDNNEPYEFGIREDGMGDEIFFPFKKGMERFPNLKIIYELIG